MAEKIYNIGSVKSVRGDPEFVKGFVDGSLKEVKAEAYEGATKIGNYAFYQNSGLKSLGIPNSVESIGNYAINGTGISELVIPESVKTIGSNSICSNSSLKSIIIKGDLETIGGTALSSNNSSAYTLYGNASYIGKGDNPYYACVKANISASNTALTVHKDCEIIANNLCSDNYTAYSNITSIIFEDGCKIKAIPDGLCGNCSKIKSFTIPENITKIGYNSLNYYSTMALEELIFNNRNKMDVHSSWLASNESALKNLKKIKINNIKAYSESNFNTPTPYHLRVPPVQDLYDENDQIITHLNIPEGTEILGYGAFAFVNNKPNTSITEITIPSTIIGINGQSNSVFSCFKNLNTININCNYDYPFFSGTAVAAPDTLTEFTMNIGKDVKVLPSYSSIFTNWQNINFTVNFHPESKLEIIKDYCFQNRKLTEINLPNTLKEIGDSAFYGTNLTEIVLPEGLTTIGNFAFGNCPVLKNFTIPDSVENLPYPIFNKSSALLETLTIPFIGKKKDNSDERTSWKSIFIKFWYCGFE